MREGIRVVTVVAKRNVYKKGQHGVILVDNGCGYAYVEFDNGDKFGMSLADLNYEKSSYKRKE